MEISEEEYLNALKIVEEYEIAKKAIEEYEAQERFKNDPVNEIMERGTVQFIEGEILRENQLLWRATKLLYVADKGSVERVISYSTDTDAKSLFSISSDKVILL